jgi:hypothetical protein
MLRSAVNFVFENEISALVLSRQQRVTAVLGRCETECGLRARFFVRLICSNWMAKICDANQSSPASPRLITSYVDTNRALSLTSTIRLAVRLYFARHASLAAKALYRSGWVLRIARAVPGANFCVYLSINSENRSTTRCRPSIRRSS